MTFKAMLRIVMNDYRKQHDEKFFTVAQELIKTRSELSKVQEQLRTVSSTSDTPSTIGLFIQYHGFFNQFCEIERTTTVSELSAQVRQLTGIPDDRRISLRVLSEDGLTTICILHDRVTRTLDSYSDCLKARMILSIEEANDGPTTTRRTFSCESDV